MKGICVRLPRNMAGFLGDMRSLNGVHGVCHGIARRFATRKSSVGTSGYSLPLLGSVGADHKDQFGYQYTGKKP